MEHCNVRKNSQFSPWKKVTSGVLLPHVEDHALLKGSSREMTTFADDINLFGVEMMEVKELFIRVSW